MPWTSDKERFEQLGLGPLLLIAVLLLLAVMGVFQMIAVWQFSEEFARAYGTSGLETDILRHKVLSGMKVAFLFASAFLLYFTDSRWAVFFTIAVMAYCNINPVLSLYSFLVGDGAELLSTYDLADLAVFVGVVAFLLLSPTISEIYQTGTRQLLTRGVANGWARLRGRPTPDQIDSERRKRTFK